MTRGLGGKISMGNYTSLWHRLVFFFYRRLSGSTAIA